MTTEECRNCGHWRRNHGPAGCHVVTGTVDGEGDQPCPCGRWVPVFTWSDEARELLTRVLDDIAARLTEDVKFERGQWVKTAPLDAGSVLNRRRRGFVEGVTICRGVLADELRDVAEWWRQ